MFLPFWPLGPIENQLKSGGLLARQSENRAGRLFSIQFNGSGGGNSQTVPLSTGHSGESLFASEEWIELHRSEQNWCVKSPVPLLFQMSALGVTNFPQKSTRTGTSKSFATGVLL
jgi:hypothetical protein